MIAALLFVSLGFAVAGIAIAVHASRPQCLWCAQPAQRGPAQLCLDHLTDPR